jgi:hypothetical protein
MINGFESYLYWLCVEECLILSTGRDRIDHLVISKGIRVLPTISSKFEMITGPTLKLTRSFLTARGLKVLRIRSHAVWKGDRLLGVG